jgi:predicted oxidoreductase
MTPQQSVIIETSKVEGLSKKFERKSVNVSQSEWFEIVIAHKNMVE